MSEALDLLKRLESPLSASQFLKAGDLIADLDGTCKEAAARIRELEAEAQADRETIADLRNLLKARADSEGTAISLIEEAVALGLRAGRSEMAEHNAEVWRRAMEAAARAADDMRASLWADTPSKCLTDIGALHEVAATIRALPLPDDLR
jgi:hypothetical protein